MGLFTRRFERNHAQAHRPDHCIFTLDGAGVRYTGDSIGLKPTTLRLSERKIAVIGANGSGKTTLLQVLDGAVKPTVGTVLIDDGERRLNPASRQDQRQITQLVGRVRREELPESYLRAASIREALGARLKRHHVPEAQGNALVGRLLA